MASYRESTHPEVGLFANGTKRLRMATPYIEAGQKPAHCSQYIARHEPGFLDRHVEMIPVTRPSLASLPDDVILHIVSYLPQLPSVTTSRHLKEAYVHLSLARSHPRFARLSRMQASQVESIDPFPDISHAEPPAHLPPYAQPSFLAFLLSLCGNVGTFRAPYVKGVLQHAGKRLRDVAFVDTGLTSADLTYLANSSLTRAIITNPSRATLAALASVKTLRDLSLLRISESSVPSVITFLSHAAVTSLFIDINSESDNPILALLHALPSLQVFVLNCHIKQVWWALRYLRRIAVRVEKVEIIVGGVRIRVKKLDECDVRSSAWETSIMRRLVFREDIGTNELDCLWQEEMSLTEIDLEAYENAYYRGLPLCDIDMLLGNYCRTQRNFEEVMHFGRTIPSLVRAELRSQRISGTGAEELVSALVISQDLVLCARNDSEDRILKFLSRLPHRFSRISALQLCAPSKERKVSGRFVMALPSFLRTTMDCCPSLQCVYLEDAGELVLQTAGISVLTDETRLRELIRGVIASIKKIEEDEQVELGTVIAQLEAWACQKLKVADGKDCEDITIIPRSISC